MIMAPCSRSPWEQLFHVNSFLLTLCGIGCISYKYELFKMLFCLFVCLPEWTQDSTFVCLRYPVYRTISFVNLSCGPLSPPVQASSRCFSKAFVTCLIACDPAQYSVIIQLPFWKQKWFYECVLEFGSLCWRWQMLNRNKWLIMGVREFYRELWDIDNSSLS